MVSRESTVGMRIPPGIKSDLSVIRMHVGGSLAEKALNVLNIFSGTDGQPAIASALKYASYSYNPDAFENVLDVVASKFDDPRAALELAEQYGKKAYQIDYPARIRRMDECAISALTDPGSDDAAELKGLLDRPGPRWAPLWVVNTLRASLQ